MTSFKYSFLFTACYFASLIQSLFNLPNIQEKILNYDYVKQVEAIKNIDYSKDMDNVEKIKMKKSVELIRALQKMFASMLLSNVKYQDPTEVLEAVVDDNGDSISIYEQKDIGEFFSIFLDRLQDGLGENKNLIRKVVAADFERQS